MVFRLNSYDEIPKWERILKSIKLRKAKVTLRGVGIFPIKINTNYSRVLYVKVDGLDEIIHEIVSKAISEGLVKEK
jgi:2'-5' RNA ligase